MNRISQTFSLTRPYAFKEKLWQWSQQFTTVLWLDSNACPHLYHKFDAVLAVNVATTLSCGISRAFNRLSAYRESTKDWIFGYLSYDLKNDIETLTSENPDRLHFPELYFFQPEKIIFITGRTATFSYLSAVKGEAGKDLRNILSYSYPLPETLSLPQRLTVKARLQKTDYLEGVHRLLTHIRRGDIYEANFCQEFYAEKAVLHPPSIYTTLNALSLAPFSAYLRFEDHYLLCTSPERYLKKEGTKIISQPIKGTAKRSSDPEKDYNLKTTLENSPKERAENIMIVDLVRNDLSRIARRGSVSVEELCKVYSFKQLHQMISTITCTAKEETDPVAIIKATFPMGSMTGAPKISAMKLIETQEVTKRGLYSGAAGYFSPEDNFDFNVVIRSILYNAPEQYVSFSVGSAITAQSHPEAEYEECLAKAAAMKQALIKIQNS